MLSLLSNIAKGREIEFFNRVDGNDPTNSALIVLVLATGGDPVETLQDYDTVAAILAGPSNEVTNTGYARKVLTDADLFPPFVSDTSNAVFAGLPQMIFTNISAGDVWDILVVAYDNDTTGGTDANLIPISFTEIRIDDTAVMANGNDITLWYNTGWIVHS